jgi:hypothetical protein
LGKKILWKSVSKLFLEKKYRESLPVFFRPSSGIHLFQRIFAFSRRSFGLLLLHQQTKSTHNENFDDNFSHITEPPDQFPLRKQ